MNHHNPSTIHPSANFEPIAGPLGEPPHPFTGILKMMGSSLPLLLTTVRRGMACTQSPKLALMVVHSLAGI
ncbi:hypothetical protein B0H13DRAFT_2187994 [Mycena leptocephala]|nr:hypothetical protein B0H13DRAFT_2187994 [Mycena leptocephala]